MIDHGVVGDDVRGDAALHHATQIGLYECVYMYVCMYVCIYIYIYIYIERER